MKPVKTFFFVITLTIVLTVLIAPGFAQTPLTAKELLENTALKEHLNELKEGQIVSIKRPETESASELNVIMAVLVPATLDKTVATLQRQATAEAGQDILAMGEIKESTASGLDSAFAKVAFTPEEKGEVKSLMAIAPGDNFNFSIAEIAAIQHKAAALGGKAKDGVEASKAMSSATREVLKGRYLSYRKSGMAGLAPYQIGASKQIDPSKEMITATETMRLVKERFPDFYKCLRFYPETNSAQFAHQYYWVKQTESNRPLFYLKHWIMDIQPDHALIAERRFYISHSLNSLQVVIGCLPNGDSTLVVLLNQAFTEKVNMKYGKTIAKSIGYKQVDKNIRPMFENLQKALRP